MPSPERSNEALVIMAISRLRLPSAEFYQRWSSRDFQALGDDHFRVGLRGAFVYERVGGEAMLSRRRSGELFLIASVRENQVTVSDLVQELRPGKLASLARQTKSLKNAYFSQNARQRASLRYP